MMLSILRWSILLPNKRIYWPIATTTLAQWAGAVVLIAIYGRGAAYMALLIFVAEIIRRALRSRYNAASTGEDMP